MTTPKTAARVTSSKVDVEFIAGNIVHTKETFERQSQGYEW